MAKVTLQDVSKIYPGAKGRDVTAVNDVSLEINDREFVVLAGPAGCGKSTTLRMIAGLEKPSRGDIFIGERRVNDVPPKDREIAMLFQNDALYPHMSVYDNVAFSLKRRKFSKAEIKKRVLDAAGIVGIESLLERKPRTLSGGQCHRVAVARALVRQPKLFLFDEPLSNLDESMRMQMRREIMKLHQRLQATMIYVTRDQAEAMALGDRIVVMNEGAVQQNDTPGALYNEPANLFVASFLGNPPMNFVNGTLKAERDSLLFFESEGGTVEVRFEPEECPAVREFAGKPLLLGIRPEDIEVAQSSREGEKSAAGFPAIVDIVEPRGAETHLHLQTGAHMIVCRSQRQFNQHEAGHRLRFEINLGKARFFDPVTTRRIV
ncbi:MAG: ATP-binding cassette domain-containing protein [Chthoniobacterales bacterium]